MTQEQKQFIIKALQTGIPAIAQEHIEALEEVAKIAEAKQEELDGQEVWKVLDEARHATIVKTIRCSLPFMAEELISAYYNAISIAQEKFAENVKARQQAEQDAREGAGDAETAAQEIGE